MKLGEMTIEQMADALVELAAPIGAIAEDEAVIDALKRISEDFAKRTPLDAIKTAVTKIIPLALKDHRADVLQVLSTLTGKAVKEIGKQNGFTTILEAKEVFNDPALVDFFTSLAGTEKGA